MTATDGDAAPVAAEATQLRPDPLQPHPARLPLATPMREAILARHERAVREGVQGYLDPATGLFVLTAQTHVDRGRCCHNGCRHCPYVGA